MSPRRRPLTRLGVYGTALLIAYALAVGAAAMSVNGLLYQARYSSFRQPADGFRIKRPNGPELSAVYLPNPKARFTLWYFHGNAEDLGNVEPRLRALRDLGFSVFAYDYPGYGLSDGQPSEKAIYESNAAALGYLRTNLGVRPESIVVYGRSLGGGPAVDVAVNQPVAGLILESAFMSVYRVMTHWRLLPFDQFENLRKIPRLRCPALVMHGRDDRVIPFFHGEALLDAIRTPKEKLWVDFAGHNDLEAVAGESYVNAVRAFRQRLETSP